MSLFEMRDFAPPKPAHADGCFYCRPNDDGTYPTLAEHTAHHLTRTCEICGHSAPNSLLFEMNHYLGKVGDIRRARPLRCTALWLMLNHLTYALLHGQAPADRDMTPIELGWRIAPDGTQLPPVDWDERFTA
jgi:hypothetical protein